MSGPFVDLGLLLGAAVAGGLAAHLLHAPPVVGYILAGILVGPATPGPTVRDLRTFELFAQIGLVLLLFSAGLEFSLQDLWRVRRVALYGTPLGMAAIVLLVTGFGGLLGWLLPHRLAAGVALSVASSTVLLKFLQDRHELGSLHGRILLGISLTQDLVAVLVLAVLPALAPAGQARTDLLLRGFLQAAVVLLPLLWLARRGVPHLLARIARARSTELFLLAVVALAVGTAAFTAHVGLSLALGAFLAGLVVSESEFAHETLSRVLPLRDVFVAVFFVSVGMLLEPRTLLEQAGAILGMGLLVAVGNALVWAAVVRAAGHSRGIAVLCGTGLAQMGEFSYLVAGAARSHGLLPESLYETILAASLLTILLNALTFRHRPAWLEGLVGMNRVTPRVASRGTGRLTGHVVLCGFGRVGQEVADALDAFGIPYAAVDLDPEALQVAKTRGARAVFGDVANPLALRQAGAERARLAVVAVPDFGAAYRCVRALRELNPHLPILVRVHRSSYRALLLEAGATEVIQPEVEAALTIVRHSLDWLGIDHDAGRAYLKRARAHWPDALRAEGVPEGLQVREVVVHNPDLVHRSLRQTRLAERTGALLASLTHPDGREIRNPGPEEILREGDRLLAIGEPDQLDALERLCGGDPRKGS
ncbi:MAG: cation:proton antiporter [Armatimonadota bacterium]|nr:cation:proton antiporter [Armatimonadota bacterium]MDR7444913.1 cation:proton antiporter [Armatimonadota bacterium]MDR7569132.1 cation:proton antiporter [Armatimonadota bacterium]MDR7613422.1 cation:proton antiporter [Armatimonadota bacterium]